MQREARDAMETAGEISDAVMALCGNSRNCDEIGIGLPWDRPPGLGWSADDYDYEFPTVELPNLGIDGSLPQLSGGKTLDEIQAQVHARVWG